MTREKIEAWLAARTPSRPAALAQRMTQFVHDCPPSSLEGSASMAACMGSLGLHALSRVNEERSATPEQAMELLAADAFVTYAFEAAAEEGVAIEPLALHLLGAA